jgi:hypothetical protein
MFGFPVTSAAAAGCFGVLPAAPPPPPPVGPAAGSALWDPATGIPTAGIAPPNPGRKSHAKKRPAGHVARPRNAWIIFRSDYVHLQKVRPAASAARGRADHACA